jgi:hypothetical protein
MPLPKADRAWTKMQRAWGHGKETGKGLKGRVKKIWGRLKHCGGGEAEYGMEELRNGKNT